MTASIWDEVSVGELRLANRAVMPAMGTGYCSIEGMVTDRLLAYFKRRAGGAGLLITEVCAVHPLGKCLTHELGAYDNSFMPGLEELAKTVKAGGSAIAMQIGHAGRETFPDLIGEQPVAPSPLCSRTLMQEPRALGVGEIAELVGCHAAAAKRAREAGFDAVEVHAAHGYLINQFLSPYSNHREDEPGGQLRASSRPEGKEAYAAWAEWAVRRLGSLGTAVETGTEADAEMLSGGWQGVVDATGAVPAIPDVPGGCSQRCVTARDVLLGTRDAGKSAVVIGAGLVGMETAEFLISRGCRVTVVEEMDYSPVLPLTAHGHHLHEAVGKGGELLLGTKVVEVTEKGALVSAGGAEREIEADTVVWAVGARPETELREAAAAAGVEVKTVGDAVEPRRVLEAVHEAHWAAWELMGYERPAG